MLITLNELGKFLYKTINEIVAELSESFFCHCKFFPSIKTNKTTEIVTIDDIEKGKTNNLFKAEEMSQQNKELNINETQVSFNLE